MMRNRLGRWVAASVALWRLGPRGVRIERFEMQRMAPTERRHLWLSFVCCMVLLG